MFRIRPYSEAALTQHVDDALVDAGEEHEEVLDQQLEGCHRDFVFPVVEVELAL